MSSISGRQNPRRRRKRTNKSQYCPAEEETLRVLHRFDQGIRAMKQYGPQSTFLGSLLTFALSMEGDYRATLSAEATMYNVTAGLLLTISVPAFLMPPSLDYGNVDTDSDLFRSYMYLMGAANFLIVISLLCSVHLVATGFGGYACAGDLSAFVFKGSYHGHAFEAKMINAPLMVGMACLMAGTGVNAMMIMETDSGDNIDGIIFCVLMCGAFIIGLAAWQTLVDWHLKLVRISDTGLKHTQMHWSSKLYSMYTWHWKLPSRNDNGTWVTFRDRSKEELGGSRKAFTCGGILGSLSGFEGDSLTSATGMTEFHALGILRNFSDFYVMGIPEPKKLYGTKHFPGGLYRWISTWELKPEWKKKVYGHTDGGMAIFVNQDARSENWANPPVQPAASDAEGTSRFGGAAFGFANAVEAVIESETWENVMQQALGGNFPEYCKMLVGIDVEDLATFTEGDAMNVLHEAGITSLQHRIKIAKNMV
jgi:hypothetical protein